MTERSGWEENGDEDDNYDDNEADLIPGDNSLPCPPSDIPVPPIPDAPDNLNHIPAQGGEIPIVAEPIINPQLKQ